MNNLEFNIKLNFRYNFIFSLVQFIEPHIMHTIQNDQ